MKPAKEIALGCGVAGALAVAIGCGIFLVLWYLSKDVQGVGVSVDSPAEVALGAEFDLSVTVTNERPRRVLHLSDIDIGEEYLDAFTVHSIDPVPKSNMHVPIDNSRSFTFDVALPPQAARTFTFRLRAQKAGLHRGDVDVCEGGRFITGMAQTVVKEGQ